jgi:hypothetical protein
MKLREHQSMSYRGQRNWPPVWTRISGPGATPLTGEIGILKHARVSFTDDTRCFLTMEYKQTRYISSLCFDDGEFCRRFVDLLQSHYGDPIDHIAQLDIL